MSLELDPNPHAEAMTSPPGDTFHPATLTPGLGELFYWPERNAFIALYPEEVRALHAEGDENSKKIAALQAANQKVTEASIALRNAQKAGVAANIAKAEAELKKAIAEMTAASDAAKKKLEPLSKLDAKDGVKMVEMVALKTPKYKNKPAPVYVKSTSLKKILADKRIYLVEGEKQKRKEDKLLKGGKLNTAEIKKRIAEGVQDKAKFSKEWKLKPDDAEEYSGVLTQWARTMNGDCATFIERKKGEFEKYAGIDPDSAERNIDLSADAQLMRYSAGAGLEMNFNPFKGNLHDARDNTWLKRVKRGVKSGEFGIKANAQASFAIAEGKVRTELYWPHFAGWHATPKVAGNQFDFGYWRFYGDLTLHGGVGASLAVEVEVAMSYTGGKQGVRGIPPQNKNRGGVKARAGVNAELDCFAGARAGVELKGALQWLNPEGESNGGKPVKVKPGDAIAEYQDMCEVTGALAGSAGIGVKGALKFGFEKGKFVVYAKLGACLGLGGDGSLKGSVGYATIGEFFKCLAYQLKRADFHKIGDAIDAEAYKAYCQIQYLIIAGGKDLQHYVSKELSELKEEFDDTVERLDRAIEKRTKEAEDFLRRMKLELSKKTGSWFSYAPPETMGKLQLQIASIGIGGDVRLSAEAADVMALALGAPQTDNQLMTIAERMTLAMGDKQDAQAGLRMIESCLAGGGRHSCLPQTQQRLAAAAPLLSQPFIWNSEPEFIAATMGVEDAMYA